MRWDKSIAVEINQKLEDKVILVLGVSGPDFHRVLETTHNKSTPNELYELEWLSSNEYMFPK